LCGTYEELDDTDKLQFLNPDITGAHALGVYPTDEIRAIQDLTFGDNQLYVPTSAFVPNIITVNKTGDPILRYRSLADYIGVDKKFTCVGLSGVSISEPYLTYIAETVDEFNRLKAKATEVSSILDSGVEDLTVGIDV
jgi:hypothetical protein